MQNILRWFRTGGLFFANYALISMAITLADADQSNPSALGHFPILAVGGDVNLGRRQNWVTSTEGSGAALGALTILRSADLVFANLESVAASTGHPVEKGERAPHYCRGRPEMLSIIEWAGIDVVGLANNHAFDYGSEALQEEIGYLTSMGIGHAGAGTDLVSACAPVFRVAGGLMVAFLAVDATLPEFSADVGRPGTCYLDPDQPEKWSKHFGARIAEARQVAHLVFVATHWGKNFAERPTEATRELARRIILAGADGILGSSAHVVHGVEVYQGRPIIYDAGNLLMDSVDTLNGGRPARSAIFTLALRPGGVERVEIWPTRVGFGRTELDAGAQARASLERVAELSAELSTKVEIHSDHASIALSPPLEPSLPLSPLKANPRPGPAPAPMAAPPRGCTVREVPVHSRLDPVDFGPVRLVGLNIEPAQVKGRRAVWLETYWTAAEQPKVDLLIDPRLEPRENGRAWQSAFHQPCDWQWPTTRWLPGVTYRDRYALRPPRKVAAGVYDLRVLIKSGYATGEVVSDHYLEASIVVK